MPRPRVALPTNNTLARHMIHVLRQDIPPPPPPAPKGPIGLNVYVDQLNAILADTANLKDKKTRADFFLDVDRQWLQMVLEWLKDLPPQHLERLVALSTNDQVSKLATDIRTAPAAEKTPLGIPEGFPPAFHQARVHVALKAARAYKKGSVEADVKEVMDLARGAALPQKQLDEIQAFLRAENQPDASIPILGVEVVKKAEEAIKGKKWQEALDLVFADLVAKGKINPALIEGGKVHFVPDLNKKYAKELGKDEKDLDIAGRATSSQQSGGLASMGTSMSPTLVEVDPTAFKHGPSFLVSVVLHEYRHALQFNPDYSDNDSLIKEKTSDSELHRAHEVEAYAKQILEAEQTGLAKNPSLIRDAWIILHNKYWPKVREYLKIKLNDLYKKAYNKARDILGKSGKDLPYKPYEPSKPSDGGTP